MGKRRRISGRRITQFITTLAYNPHVSGYFTGKLYNGAAKGVCVPGLNCYSCPGAAGACPLGSLQSELAVGHKPYYVLGTLLLFGTLLGRFICAWLCPFGLVQELIYKLHTPKLKKSRVTQALSYLKYAVLLAFVIYLPLYLLARNGIGAPTFCKFICPAGTLGAGIPMLLLNPQLQAQAGVLFALKLSILIALLVLSAFLFRPFCRFICPLGALYSLFNRIALFGVRVDGKKCTSCGACTRFCKLDVRRVNGLECIRCGECARVCNENAIYTVTPATLFKRKDTEK